MSTILECLVAAAILSEKRIRICRRRGRGVLLPFLIRVAVRNVEGLSKHLLDDANGVRAVIQAIKIILDHGADARLRTLCTARCV